jgi:hypothetical protein
MTLEENRTSRDYLFGRLLAIADRIEGKALYNAKEYRETTAARLMQRFANYPLSTWRTIELALAPYKTRLRRLRGGFIPSMEKLIDDIMELFQVDDFMKDIPLSGEFLLGFSCQRKVLLSYKQRYHEYLKSEKWLKIRAKVLEEADGRCQNVRPDGNKCGAIATIVHHPAYDNIFHESPNELKAVCRLCHESIHGIETDNEPI